MTVAAGSLLMGSLAACDDGRSVDAFCSVHDKYKDRYLTSMQAATEKLNGQFLSGLLQGAAAIGDLSNMWNALADVAPDEIRSDAETVAERWQKQADLAAEFIDHPLKAAASALGGALQAAGPLNRVDQFVKDHCDPA